MWKSSVFRLRLCGLGRAGMLPFCCLPLRQVLLLSPPDFAPLQYRTTPLHFAVGQPALVTELLDRGADMGAKVNVSNGDAARTYPFFPGCVHWYWGIEGVGWGGWGAVMTSGPGSLCPFNFPAPRVSLLFPCTACAAAGWGHVSPLGCARRLHCGGPNTARPGRGCGREIRCE